MKFTISRCPLCRNKLKKVKGKKVCPVCKVEVVGDTFMQPPLGQE